VSTWELAYDGFDPESERLREALCTVGNGYFASRGAAPEARADQVHYPGTYVAGLFDRLTTQVKGRPVENEDLVNVPNWLPLTFRVDAGEEFRLDDVEILDYRQVLDLRRATLHRDVRFRDRDGRTTHLVQRRFVSMADPHLAALETTLTAEDWSGRLTVSSALDGTVTNAGVPRYASLRGDHLVPLDSGEEGEEAIWLRVVTRQSGVRVAEAARTRVLRGGAAAEVARRTIEEPGYVAQELELDVAAGDTVVVEKVVALATSRDPVSSEPGVEVRAAIRRAAGFEDLLAHHATRWDVLWGRFRLQLAGFERAQFVLNVHIYHLLVTVSENTVGLDVGVPARGLHGEAYRGHIFWDELFIFPFLNLRAPEITRSLLLYRYRRLPEARHAAAEEGYRGAMYPWQSGSTGREESQQLHLNPQSGNWLPDASHLQRHINHAIAYNVWLHYQVTDDLEFLSFYGAEMLLEIARFWASIATRDESTGRYAIRGVMGPDEYHEGYPGRVRPGLDNNAYTNVMATWVLQRAFDVLDRLPRERCAELRRVLGIDDEELAHWDDVSRHLTIPFHDGVVSQFEGYGDLEEFDWQGYRERYGNISRLDRILEAEGDSPDHYKLSKQADVLMLFYLLSAEELAELFTRLGYDFPPDLIPRTVDYYLERTSHGSTLSRVVHAWVLARSDRSRSWDLFTQALESDVSDIQGGTTAEGIHLGAMAGTVDLVQRGYAGLVVRGDVLHLDPELPEVLDEIAFTVRFRRLWAVDVRIRRDGLCVHTGSSTDGALRIGFRDKVIELGPGQTLDLEL
jgi:alpha,alpha-trehalase